MAWLGGAGATGAEPVSIARIWNERALAAIRVDTPHPPAQARNLFSLSVALYDAWAAYDPQAVGVVYREKHAAADLASARRAALSYAAFRLLNERHAFSRTAEASQAANAAQMAVLGYDPDVQSRDRSTPAGVGNAVYDAVSLWFIDDGARQRSGVPFPRANPPIAYPDFPANQGGYVYLNPPLATSLPGIDDGTGRTVVDVNHWQRLYVVNAVDQSGFPIGALQTYLGAHWSGVRPFALGIPGAAMPWIDPGPPPRFGSESHADFVSNVVEVIRCGSELDPDDGEMLDISPGAFGNSSLGTNDGKGHALNPFTGQPYTPNRVRRGDFTRVLAEYWADGPSSETPPGHWNSLANQAGDHPAFERRLTGTGPVLDRLEWDVKLYLVLNAALHDAACAAWSVKRHYDGWRPLTAVRYLANLGQSTEPTAPRFHPQGLPLRTNLIEVVTRETVVSGRHAGLIPGRIAVRGWPGGSALPPAGYHGVHWVHGDSWTPYQRTNFVSPAFPGFVSGHSTFSRAAAEVLTAITGSAFFPGGLGTHAVPAGTALIHERGPRDPVELQWATYFDAADQAGLSRIWGGIHPPADDFAGRRIGAEVGRKSWLRVLPFWDGTEAGPRLVISRGSLGAYQIRAAVPAGRQAHLESAPNASGPFVPDSAAPQADDQPGWVRWDLQHQGACLFHRVVIASPAGVR